MYICLVSGSFKSGWLSGWLFGINLKYGLSKVCLGFINL